MIIGDLLNLARREKKVKMKKRKILGHVIEIGSSVVIGAASGIYLTLRSRRKKQMNLNSESEYTVDAIKSTVRNKADDVLAIVKSTMDEADDVAKAAHEKTKEVIKDTRQGHDKIKKDINKQPKTFRTS